MTDNLEIMVVGMRDEIVRLRVAFEALERSREACIAEGYRDADGLHQEIAALNKTVAGMEEERAQLIRDLNQEIARADKAEAKVAWWEEDKDEVKMVKTVNAYRHALEEHAHECDDIQWCVKVEELLEENPFGDEQS